MMKKVPTILSIWSDEPSQKIELLREHALDIVLNIQPTIKGGPNSRVNYPNTTLVNGCKRAKELGFTHAMQFRVDTYCPTICKLIDIFKNTSSEKLVGICWFHHIAEGAPYGYIMDHIMYGPIDLLIQYRSTYQSIDDKRHVGEAFLQESFFKKSPVKYEDSRTQFDYVLDKLIENKQEIYFTHHHTGQGDVIQVYKNQGSKCQS
jgi:hypothetical protein